MRDEPKSAAAALSDSQTQTQRTFAFKWQRRGTYESPALLAQARQWLLDRYFEGSEAALRALLKPGTRLLDAGCGAGYSALALFDEILKDIRYTGADISAAAAVARQRFQEAGLPGSFVQSHLLALPFPDNAFDVVFSEGVLHHTDSTRAALAAITRVTKPNGHVLFYVYRKKGPVREFTDDYIRARIAGMSDEAAWEALRPLTRLGQTLGELNAQIEIPEDIEVLGIPKGSYDLQRFFYWHVCKMFYRPDISEEEMLHINFDWFRPTNAHRHTPEEIAAWCAELDLEIEHRDLQESGITIVARKAA